MKHSCTCYLTEIKTRSKIFGLQGLSLPQTVDADLAVLVVLPGEPYLQKMPGGTETHSKTPAKSWTMSETKAGAKLRPQGSKFSGQSTLEAYQAIYFRRIEDPEILPGNILSQDTDAETLPGNILTFGSRLLNHTRQHTYFGSRSLQHAGQYTHFG